jgi:hypothetical protein
MHLLYKINMLFIYVPFGSPAEYLSVQTAATLFNSSGPAASIKMAINELSTLRITG